MPRVRFRHVLRYCRVYVLIHGHLPQRWELRRYFGQADSRPRPALRMVRR